MTAIHRTGILGLTLLGALAAGLFGIGPAAWGQEAEPKTPVIEEPRTFIQRHKDAYEKRLAELRARFSECCGSDVALLATSDSGAIEEGLQKPTPIPTKLKFILNLPSPFPKISGMPEIERGDFKPPYEYFVGAMDVVPYTVGVFGGTSFRVSRPGPVAGIGSETEPAVAADLLTAAVLHIPEQIGLLVYGSAWWTGKAPEYATQACRGDRPLSYLGGHWEPVDLRPATRELGLTLGGSAGVVKPDLSRWTVSFTRPGIHRVTVSTDRAAKFKSEWGSWCLRSVGKTEQSLAFNAVRIVKFGFPGLDFSDPEGKGVAQLDAFFESEESSDRVRGTFSRTQRLPSPKLLIEYGAGGGTRQGVFPPGAYSWWSLPVTWSVAQAGPFTVSQGGVAYYNGGLGATRVRATLAGQLSAEHALTANLIQVEEDPRLADRSVAADASYPVRFRVRGPADMTRYQVAWSVEDTGGQGPQVAWQAATTPFTRVGDAEWVAENRFTVKPSESSPILRLGSLGAEVRVPGGQAVLSYSSRDLFLRGREIVAFQLFAARGKGPFEPVKDPADLFLPNDLADANLLLAPYVSFRDGRSYPLRTVDDTIRLEVKLSDPSMLRLSDVLEVMPAWRSGSAEVTGRIGGDLDPLGKLEFGEGRTELVSPPVRVNLHRLFLSTAEASGGRRLYRLRVIGPGEPGGYRAVWIGEGGPRETAFQKDAEGGFVAELATTLRVEKVQVRRKEEVVAELAASRWAVPQGKIHLVAAEPPVTTIKKATPADAASLETLAECRERITAAMENLGLNPRATLDAYCRAEHEQRKQEIKAEREQQKALNRLIRELGQRGEELVVFGDTMRVGAAITGLPPEHWGNTYCQWRLRLRGAEASPWALRLEREVTPILAVSPNEGACFNLVSGIREGFNPDVDVHVELVLQVSRGGVPTVESRWIGHAGRFPEQRGR